MRSIDADAFEQDLKEKLLPLLVEKYGKEEAMKGLHFSLQDCISNIQSQPTITQPEPKWIPCSERLPDNDESVLISNSHGVTKAWWNGRCWTSIAAKKYKTVTAWMPLPEPYKEGEQNETD